MHRGELRQALLDWGQEPRANLLADAALWLGALDRPDADLAACERHLRDIAAAAKARFTGQSFSAREGVEALSEILGRGFHYEGDRAQYDAPENANLVDVIARRKGLPVALGILYLHAGHAAGLDITGLNFPAHFVLRLEAAGEMAILDPFNKGAEMSARDLRLLLEQAMGPGARLDPDYYQPVTPRLVLLRLQNNLLTRALQAGDEEKGAEYLARMSWIAPDEAAIRYDLGKLHTRLARYGDALEDFRQTIDLARAQDNWTLATEAAQILERLRKKLN